jgi:hypothetical protein
MRNLEPAEVTRNYRQIQGTDPEQPVARAYTQYLTWKAAYGANHADHVVIVKTIISLISHMHWGVKFLNTTLQSIQ